ncbi:MAG TPA: hypothetical protein VK607_07120 [Kofleriaceae bacterium]|nr:hypothetical protein [Kofleriaceae bacterium]HMG57145.1 hypothetical protein [Kofleriaceae bacterium]
MSLVLAIAGMVGGGCATADGDAEADTSSELTGFVPSFTLHVSADENSVVVLQPNGPSNTCPNPNGCDFAYLGGTQLTIKPFPLIDRINCVMFSNWVGEVCHGQGSTCLFPLTADTSVHAHWIPLKGCVPTIRIHDASE